MQMLIYWFECQLNVLLCVQSTVNQHLFSQMVQKINNAFSCVIPVLCLDHI